MKNPNRDFFRYIYPKHWISDQRFRAGNLSHYQYQEITLASLDCFDGCSLLECGCGSGELLARLRRRYADIQLFGIDLGHHSLVWAKEEGPCKHKEKSAHFIEGDVTAMPLASNLFDRVLCSSVLWYVLEPYLAIQEMIRVLKPGGRFGFDVRNPYHITNLLTQGTLIARRVVGKRVISYSFSSPHTLSRFLETLPINFEIVGYFVLLPPRLPLLGSKWGNWARLSPWLSFKAGRGKARWLAQKLLVSGYKLSG